MNIIDLTESYQKNILGAQNIYLYEQSYPIFFQHYFKYWAGRKYSLNQLSAPVIVKRKKIIIKALKCIEKTIASAGFKINNLNVIIFVGQGTSNGHTFKDGDKFIVWLPIEGYETKLQAKIFITHEIIHALHYTQRPDFYFHNIGEKRSLIRQVITEGIATFFTMEVLNINHGVALWADYISKSKIKIWLQKCQHKENDLYKFVLNNFFSSNPKIGLFYANDSLNILQYRSGYYIGLKLIEDIIANKKIDKHALLKISRKKFENIAKRWFKEKILF